MTIYRHKQGGGGYRALKACTGAERAYTAFFGEAVPHAHIYVTARYPGTPHEYWRMDLEQWPDAREEARWGCSPLWAAAHLPGKRIIEGSRV